LYFILEKDKI